MGGVPARGRGMCAAMGGDKRGPYWPGRFWTVLDGPWGGRPGGRRPSLVLVGTAEMYIR